MTARERSIFDALQGASSFGINNASDFQPVPPALNTKAQELFAALGTVADGEEETEKDTVLGNLIRAVKDQEASEGDFHGGTTSKSVQREGLMDALRKWNGTAAAIATARKAPEIMDSFRMPHGTNDSVIAARARAFADAAEPLKAAFIALEMRVDFIERLRKRVADFEKAQNDQGDGLSDRAGATAGIGSWIGEGLVIHKQLDAAMQNKYEDNPEKLAAWQTASNIQRTSGNGKPAAPVPMPAPAPKQALAA